jgi:hypothetical protein
MSAVATEVRGTLDLAAVRARYSVRAVLSRYPALYLPMVAHKPSAEGEKIVDARTDLVIEGFPRSGNTFTVVAFEMAQTRSLRIAHHLHAAAQIVRGVRLGRPVLVLLRDPGDAALSHLVRQPGITARQALHNWIRFYRPVESLREGVCIATFEDVTTDLGAVIGRVNDRFGTSFARFDHTPENVRRTFERIETKNRSTYARIEESKIARPSSDRDATKASLRALLEEPSLRPLVDTARELHRSLTAGRTRVGGGGA